MVQIIKDANGKYVMNCLKCNHVTECVDEENEGCPFCKELGAVLYGNVPTEHCPLPESEKEKGEIIWRCQCGQDIDDSLAVCPFCGRLHRIQFQEPQPQNIEQELKKYDSLERQ